MRERERARGCGAPAFSISFSKFFPGGVMNIVQAQDLFRNLKLPEFDDVREYMNSISANTLMGFGAFAAFTYWYATRPKALEPAYDVTMQSVEIEGGELARRSALVEELIEYYYDDVKTVYDGFMRGLKISKNAPCLGARKKNKPYQWITYQEVADRAQYIGSALLQQGLDPSPDQFIGIFAQNRPEWVITELGCYTYSMVTVPLYDTLGTEAIVYVINKADLSVVFCDTVEKTDILLNSVENGEIKNLHTIIIIDPFQPDLVEKGKNCGVTIFSLKEIEALGKANLQDPKPPKSEDLSVICFTSGTTGFPKGAMLTHKNVISDCSGFLKASEKSCPISPSDTLISYLPLVHMFERLVQCTLLTHGARIGFFQGDIKLLPEDIKALRPTVFPVVPRLLNRMYDKIYAQANTPLKRWILGIAARKKEAELKNGIVRRNSVWDKLVFHKVQGNLGGKVRLIITGAAPVSPNVLTFMRAAIGCQFYEGYGQTESAAGSTLTVPGDWTAGHVGAPLPCNLIKLVDVDDMNYFAAQGEGEVCLKGPNIFIGYLRDPEKTAEALDNDGWLHTGDVGKWLPNGSLKIIDRKKHIFKLAQGEYIAPEKIENVYMRSEPVAQVFVHGDSLQASLVGIVIPDPEVMPKWAKKKKFNGSFEDLCKNKDLKKAILEDLLRLGKESDLKTFEQVRDIALYPEMLTVQNGLLTPTMKAKRPELRKFFQSQIEELYASL
ncbi:long-chain-fatty-acid--CoA ligase 1 isoform X2 [Rhinatrema bivittatum]|uniref:long-chain-fatty-acid--CoA ligase 1 isoform X2 n=1 Tax=Rhinatrema bivittatum TaxID=194408 RepID=UPI0011270C00|nr:long-chain-fatty-acid--CoA ligase 1 isoform X2 [Rhinatrema bivittatum]